MYQKTAPESIKKMFASIAKNYDRANTTFSLGLHKRWNKKLIDAVGETEILLDLCAGTGEIAFGYLNKYPNAQAILLDFCPEMLEIAKQKGGAFKGRYRVIEADAQHLPFEDHSIDSVTISYGIRNVKDPQQCFKEVARVLKPKGHFIILELTRPSSFFLRFLHQMYLRGVLPFLGKIAAKDLDAYRYLSKSIENFTTAEEIEEKLSKEGLQTIKRTVLMGGFSTLIMTRSEQKSIA